MAEAGRLRQMQEKLESSSSSSVEEEKKE